MIDTSANINESSELIELPRALRSLEGCDLDWHRNSLQLAFVVAGTVVGTVVGAIGARPEFALGAVVGALPGAIVGTFAGGAYVGWRARSPAAITKEQLKQRIASLEAQFRWWYRCLVIGGLVGLGSLPFLLHWNAGWACPLSMLVLIGVPALKGITLAIGQRLQEYRKILNAHSNQALQ